jgi:hypothetical protein
LPPAGDEVLVCIRFFVGFYWTFTGSASLIFITTVVIQILLLIMLPKRLPAKTTGVIIALLSFFIFATVNPFASSDAHTSWTQYGGGPDRRLNADGNTAVISIFMH